MSVAYAISFQAVLSGTATAGSAGDVLLPSTADGLYVRATAANRGTRRSTGIALSSYVAAGVVDIQQEGEVSAALSGLGAGTATYVRVSATGSLERVASPGGTDDVVGWCETDGTLHLRCGQIPGGYGAGGGGGGATLPIDMADPASVTGVLAAANGGTGSSSLPAGGIAGLTAMAAGDAASLASAQTYADGAIVTERTASRTLTGATISGASNTITNVSIATGVSGLGSNVGTWLTTPSSANLLAAMTDKSGTGLCLFGTSPTIRTTLLLRNPADTFNYIVTPAAIAADRILNLPLLTATDTVAVLAFAQTFTNKSLVLASNTITDTSQALGDIAYCNGTRFVRFARGATAGQSLTATATTIAYSSNPGVAAQAIAALAIDWTAGIIHTKALGVGSNTFTFSNAASGLSVSVRVTANAGGSTATWPTMKWCGDVAPTFTAGKATVITLMHDGTNVIGVASAEYTP